MKSRYTLRVQGIGEYVFNATLKGLQELIDKIKPEFQFDILSTHGIVYARVGS
jgi:hypothetical protein